MEAQDMGGAVQEKDSHQAPCHRKIATATWLLGYDMI